MHSHLSISVVVCTYDRAELLRRALRCLCEQELAPIRYEVIVVDNASRDETSVVCQEYCERYPNFHYAFEGRQGLSNARNRGWLVARGRYIGYIDDDCEAPRGWLTLAQEIIDLRAPAAFGGPFRRYFASSKPTWFRDSYIASNSLTHEGLEAGFLGPGGHEKLWGGNLFLDRAGLERVGGFDPDLGLRGRSLGYGEETALLQQVCALYPDRLYYDPRLYVYEPIRPEKLTLVFRMRDSFARGRAAHRLKSVRLKRKGVVRSLLKCLEALLRVGGDFLYGGVLRSRTRYPFWENYLYEHTSIRVKELGRCYAELSSSGPERPARERAVSDTV